MNNFKKKYMVAHKLAPMDFPKKVETLKKFPIFKGASDSEVEAFAKKVIPVLIHPMEIFVEEDMDEHEAYFVYKGAVSVFRMTKDGEFINIDLLGAPDLVGEMGLVDNKLSPASAMAIDEVHALILSQKDFQELLENNPSLSLRFIKLLADRIRHFDIFLEELLSKNLYERTWHTLQFLSQYFSNNEISLSQEQLADLLWGTRSRVTEVLNRLEKEGKIITTRKKVKVL